MTIRDFQYISTLDSGSTTYEDDLITYFKIDTTKTIEEVAEELKKALFIAPRKVGRNVRFNDKIWKVQKVFLDESFAQWKRLEMLLAGENYEKNLHRLIAIYFRPRNKFGIVKKFDLKTQEKIEEELLDLDMGIAQGLMATFFLSVTKRMRNINIFYLNQMKKQKS